MRARSRTRAPRARRAHRRGKMSTAQSPRGLAAGLFRQFNVAFWSESISHRRRRRRRLRVCACVCERVYMCTRVRVLCCFRRVSYVCVVAVVVVSSLRTKSSVWCVHACVRRLCVRFVCFARAYPRMCSQ